MSSIITISKAYKTKNVIRKWEMEFLASNRNKTLLPTSVLLFYITIKWLFSFTVLWVIITQNVKASLYFSRKTARFGGGDVGFCVYLTNKWKLLEKRHERTFTIKIRVKHEEVSELKLLRAEYINWRPASVFQFSVNFL